MLECATDGGQVSRPSPSREPSVRPRRARRSRSRTRARRFTEDVLIPLEEQAEALRGRLPADVVEEVKREALAAGLAGPLHARERGGQGFTRMQWALVEEQYGRSTNAIHWHIPNGYNVWEHAGDAHQTALARAPPARRDPRCLRRHRARRRLRSLTDRGDGPPDRRRLPDQRREVVRHLRRRLLGDRRDGEPDRGRRAAADAVRGRPRAARHRVRRRPRASPTAIPTGIRRSSSATSRSVPTR